MAGLIVYFIAVSFLSYQTGGVQEQVAAMGQSYTNAIQIKARYAVLKSGKNSPTPRWTAGKATGGTDRPKA